MYGLKVESKDLAILSKQIRKSGNAKQIRKDLLTGLRNGAKPAVTRVRSHALVLPSHGKKHTGLRVKMASATGTQVRTAGAQAGVTVRLSRAKMGAQAGVALSTNKTNWRHPVYGDTKVWVTQRSSPGWFDRDVRVSAPGVRKNIEGVLNKIEKDLTHN